MLRYLTEEPEWETQDCVHIITANGTHIERFTGQGGIVYLALSYAGTNTISWCETTPEHWNELVDRSVETYGTDLYLKEN